MSVSSHLKFFVLFTMFVSCQLAATSIKLEVSDNGHGSPGGQNISTGVPFEATVSVTDGDRNTGNIELVCPDQVKVIGTSRSTNISMLNGHFSSQTSYIYQLQALENGPLKLGPARLKQGSNTIESNILDLKVLSTCSNAAQAGKVEKSGGSQPTTNQGPAPIASADQPKSDQETAVLCRLTTDKKTIVVGEPIVAKVTILSRGQVAQVGMEPPKFPGFMVKEIQNIGRRQENFNNTLHNVLEKKYVLIPSEQGEKTIEPVKVSYAVPVRNHPRHRGLFDDAFLAGFFGQESLEQKATTSNALPITVQPLPTYQGQIDGVGVFTSFTARVNKKDAHVNEALTLKLEVAGRGNLDQIPTPKLILPAFMKAYESKSAVQEDLSTDYQGGKKTFEYVIQIAQEGDAEITPQQFTYFDTSAKTFKTLQTAPLTVHLTPAPQTTREALTPQTPAQELDEEPLPKPESLGKKDISFIQEDGPVTHRPSTGMNFILFLIFLLLLPGLMFGTQFINQSKRTFFPYLVKNRIHKKELEKLHKEFEVLLRQNHLDKLYQFFVKFLATKYHVGLETITQDWLAERLAKDEWSEKTINEFFDFLNECAGLHFTSRAGGTNNQHEELLKNGSYWLSLLSEDPHKINISPTNKKVLS